MANVGSIGAAAAATGAMLIWDTVVVFPPGCTDNGLWYSIVPGDDGVLLLLMILNFGCSGDFPLWGGVVGLGEDVTWVLGVNVLNEDDDDWATDGCAAACVIDNCCCNCVRAT